MNNSLPGVSWRTVWTVQYCWLFSPGFSVLHHRTFTAMTLHQCLRIVSNWNGITAIRHCLANVYILCLLLLLLLFLYHRGPSNGAVCCPLDQFILLLFAPFRFSPSISVRCSFHFSKSDSSQCTRTIASGILLEALGPSVVPTIAF